MIPLWMTLHIRHAGRTAIRLWLPLFLLWILLLPLVVLAAPFLLIAALVARLKPLASAAAIWGVLNAIRGTRVEVEAPQSRVFIHIA